VRPTRIIYPMETQGTFWMPPQASTAAADIDALFAFVLWTSVIILGGVVFFMAYYAWKYRRRSAADRPVDVEPSKALEISWVIVPTLLVLAVFWWGMQAFISAGIPPANAYQINVYGKKWLWEFEYPNGKRTVGEMVVPVGQPVQLVMTSEDVLHSFFVPAFRVKKDAVPNRYTTLWFEATHEGEYQVLCTEYCGTAHSTMYAKVVAVDRGTFSAWLQATDEGEGVPLPELGAQLFRAQACNACHSIDGSPGVGPTWLGTWGEMRPLTDGTSVRMDEDYFIESIIYPNAKIVQGYPPAMPAYPNLTERQLQGLVAYMKEINGVWTDEAAIAAEEQLGGEAPADGDAAEPADAPDAPVTE
jgi:cytochrome c oxidase subunit II